MTHEEMLEEAERRENSNRHHRWKLIYNDLTQNHGVYHMGEVNYSQLTSMLEELYERIDELQQEVCQLRNCHTPVAEPPARK